jgi:hypothetical protein
MENANVAYKELPSTSSIYMRLLLGIGRGVLLSRTSSLAAAFLGVMELNF